ncbi:MAG: ribosomal RNA small subunit methyltransferase A [Armatimonadetes bacterium]|nr:ribosomal RNA small subunit methyltransferase A [Armatimonadota bacterium]
MRFYLKKKLGQHFLKDKNILSKIIKEAQITPEDLVLEIGAGSGILTKELTASGAAILAVEIDQNFKKDLESLTLNYPNLKLIWGNILKINYLEYLNAYSGKWKILGNLPYYISTPILISLTKIKKELINFILFTLQKEVAERICAESGNKKYGSLTLIMNYYFKSQLLFIIPKEAFFPKPKVDSALVKLTPRDIFLNVGNEELFFKIIRASFQKRRKTLLNALKNAEFLNSLKLKDLFKQSEIDPQRRAETLSLEEFARISQIASKFY